MTSSTAQPAVPAPPGPLSLGMKVGYGVGLFGISLAQLGVSTLLMYFYTDVMGFPPATAGMLMLVAGLTDCVANLLAAYLATHSWSRLGRYRPFLIYGAAPLGICFALLFFKPPLPATMLVVFALVVTIIYRMSFAFVSVPHSTLITRMSSDANERASIGGIKAIAGGLGTAGAGYLGVGLIGWLGGADEVTGFLYFGVILGISTALSVAFSGYVTQERVQPPEGHDHRPSLLTAISHTARNRALMAILIANILFFIGYTFLFAGAAYYFKYIYADPSQTKVAVLCAAIGAIVAPPFWVALAKRVGKRTTWICGSIVVALAFVGLYLSEGVPLGLILLFYGLLGAGKASVLMNYYSMTADAVDFGQWRLGRRIETYSFGFLALTAKLGLAVGGGLMGIALGWSGFEANTVLDESVLLRLRAAIFLVPAVVVIGSAIAISFFSVSNALHRQIMRELAAREAGSDQVSI